MKDNEATQKSQVKRFVAKNMRRALDLVREELGPEAVILSSQKVKEGVEIITSVEPDLMTRGVDERRGFGQKFDAELDSAMSSDGAWRSQADFENAVSRYSHQQDLSANSFSTRLPSSDLALEIERARERMLEAKRKAKESNAPIGTGYQKDQGVNDSPDKVMAEKSVIKKQEIYNESIDLDSVRDTAQATQTSPYQQENDRDKNQEEEKRLNELQSELAEMRMLLEQQLWRTLGNQNDSVGLNKQQQIKMPGQYPVVREHIQRLGLTENLTDYLIEQSGQHKRANDAWRDSMAHLAQTIPISESDLIRDGGTYAFVGQTGVGKTTSIAKLAALYVMQHGEGKVALVTTDTYRVGAYDQLRSIGRILNVPVRVVDTENSLLTQLARLRKYSLVLVDTAGFRYGDAQLKKQLNQLDACRTLQKILVLSSASQLPTNKASIHAFTSQKPIHSCVVTKLDETASLGEAISAVVEGNIPVAYTTDGQEIPEDIERATGKGIVSKAVKMTKQANGLINSSASNQ